MLSYVCPICITMVNPGGLSLRSLCQEDRKVMDELDDRVEYVYVLQGSARDLIRQNETNGKI